MLNRQLLANTGTQEPEIMFSSCYYLTRLCMFWNSKPCIYRFKLSPKAMIINCTYTLTRLYVNATLNKSVQVMRYVSDPRRIIPLISFLLTLFTIPLHLILFIEYPLIHFVINQCWGVIYNDQLISQCHWQMWGNWYSERKPNKSWSEHANSTQIAQELQSNLGPWSCCCTKCHSIPRYNKPHYKTYSRIYCRNSYSTYTIR